MLRPIVLVFGLACLAAADIVIREAGRNGKIGPTLRQGGVINEFCPETFSARGFSIECTELAAPVRFFVNEKYVRTEKRSPFLVGSNREDRSAIAWDYPTKRFLLQCISEGRRRSTQTARVHIVCPVGPPIAEPSMEPTMEPTIEPPMESTMEPTPAPPVKKPAPAPPAPPAIPGPSEKPAPTASPPPLASPPPPANPAPPAEPVPPVSPVSCVKMTASEAGPLSVGWTREGESIWFKKGSKERARAKPGAADVMFTFVAPMTGQFGITLDMETAGSVDHNGK